MFQQSGRGKPCTGFPVINRYGAIGFQFHQVNVTLNGAGRTDAVDKQLFCFELSPRRVKVLAEVGHILDPFLFDGIIAAKILRKSKAEGFTFIQGTM